MTTPTAADADTTPSSGLLIDENDEAELAFWSALFGVSALEIRHAIGMVGRAEYAVHCYLTGFRKAGGRPH
jgi:hypothetical protein